ncbi:Uncharacterised protein [Salmonella enterica]|uniref:hypothetical protein n=1 Tax=Salmonella enterica TaxID=28901 RepID=UPI0003BD0C9C|nr:hypothetical protein [Salmonella enterica]ESH08323.1 hypothetical protein SEEH1956_04025 [Salmonella enterica subsp. enterica serovar Hadar str. ATCC 51956]SUF82991.1 Uncharacterised protein [Salmonella enterica]
MKRHLYAVPLDGKDVEQIASIPHNDFKDGNGSGGGDDVLQRVKELEVKVATLVTDVAIIKDKLASKEDIQSVKTELHKELNAQTWKIIGSLVVAVLIAVLSKYYIK